MGSFSHEAASKLIGELKPKPTITEVFESVSKSSDSLGVVPIENSLEGPVNESYIGYTSMTTYTSTMK